MNNDDLVKQLTNVWPQYIYLIVAVLCIIGLNSFDGLPAKIIFGYAAMTTGIMALLRWHTRRQILKHEANKQTGS